MGDGHLPIEEKEVCGLPCVLMLKKFVKKFVKKKNISRRAGAQKIRKKKVKNDKSTRIESVNQFAEFNPNH